MPETATKPVSKDDRLDPAKIVRARRFPMLGYVLRRALAGFATLFVASALIFGSIQILPGNVIQVVLGRSASPERLAQLESQLQLNGSLWHRYLAYVGNFVRGDFGESTAAMVQGSHIAVGDVVWPAVGNSLILSSIVLLFFIPLAGSIGLISGLRPGGLIDHFLSNSTLAVSALPEFLIGTMLIFVFFLKLGWFPPISAVPDSGSPLSDLSSLVLPVLTLLLISLAFGARQLRASVVEVMTREYISVARLNGIGEGRIIFRYLLPNALVPSVQILAQQIQYLLGGIVVVESVFNYPGIGQKLVRAIAARDIQEIMIIATVLAFTYIAINILADIAGMLLDPRVRTSL